MKMSFFPNAAYQALRCVIATTLICAVSLPTNHRALGDDGSDIATEVESDDETNSLERNLLIRGRVTDENGNPVVGATIRTITRSKEMDLQTTSRGGGAFALKVHAPGHYGPSLMVTDPSGELASFVSRYQSMTRDRKMFNVVVKPWQTTTVTVVDENELPVVGATVVLQADFQELARKQTDAAGKANLQFPADARVDWINALKDDVGYDYYENYDAFPTQERLNVPQSIKLTLRGAVSVIVTVIDDLNNPVEGASISPWTIKVPNKISYANVGGTLRYQTNEDGQVEIPWIPKDLVGACTMLVHHQHYHCPKTPPYYAGQETELTANVFRNAIVTGQVTFADGSPAANIRLQGEGRGNTNHYFRGHTSTGSDGRYEIKVYPNQDTIIAVTDDNYAARTAMGINLAPAGKHNADFVLTSGTLIHGVLTVGKDKEPLTGENATLI